MPIAPALYYCRFKDVGCKHKPYTKHGKCLVKHESECTANPNRISLTPGAVDAGQTVKRTRDECGGQKPERTTSKRAKRTAPQIDDRRSADDVSDYDDNDLLDTESIDDDMCNPDDIPELPSTAVAQTPPSPCAASVASATRTRDDDSSSSDRHSSGSYSDNDDAVDETTSGRKRRLRREERQRKIVKKLRHEIKRQRKHKNKSNAQAEEDPIQAFARPLITQPIVGMSTFTIIPSLDHYQHAFDPIASQEFHDSVEQYLADKQREYQSMKQRLQKVQDTTSELVRKIIAEDDRQMMHMRELANIGMSVP